MPAITTQNPAQGPVPISDVTGSWAVNVNNDGSIQPLPKIVQKANAKSTGSVTTLAATFTSNNSAGNSIIVVAASGCNTAMTVADSAGNTYTSAIAKAQSTTVGVGIFYAVGIVSGANTVTVTCASSSAAVEIYEVSGIVQTVLGALGQSSSGSSASGATATTSTIAGPPNSIAFFGVGIGTAAQNITVTTGTNWTADGGTNGLVTGATVSGLYQFNSFSQPLYNTLPVLPTATIGSAEPYACVAAIFRPVVATVEGTVTIGGYNYTNITAAAPTTTLVKTGAGILHAIVINTPVATGSIELDDALTHTTPKIGTVVTPATANNPCTVIYDIAFATGLTVYTSVAAQDITVVWR